VFTAIAFLNESNLWPIWLLFASPIALLYLVILTLLSSLPKQSSPDAE